MSLVLASISLFGLSHLQSWHHRGLGLGRPAAGGRGRGWNGQWVGVGRIAGGGTAWSAARLAGADIAGDLFAAATDRAKKEGLATDDRIGDTDKLPLMAAPQLPQTASPASSVGPLTVRGAVTL